MDECPFCGRPIDESIARFGGTCPSCFVDVPGEEAATDPGAEPEVLPRRGLGAALAISGGAVLGVSIMILLAIGLRMAQGPAQPEPTVLDFDDWPMPEVIAVQEAPPDEPAPASGRPRSHVRAPGTPVAFVAPEALAPPEDVTASLRAASSAPRSASIRRREPGRGAPVPSVGGARTLDRSAGTASLDISLAGGRVERDDNVVLDDPVAIRMMIGERLRRGIAELRGCYDRRLKQRPDLSGRWRLTFTVAPDGRAVDADLDSLDEADEALEGCLREHVVQRWAFARVAEPTEVSKTLSFHVGR